LYLQILPVGKISANSPTVNFTNDVNNILSILALGRCLDNVNQC